MEICTKEISSASVLERYGHDFNYYINNYLNEEQSSLKNIPNLNISPPAIIQNDDESIYYCNDCKEHSVVTFDSIMLCKLCNRDYGSCIDNCAEWRSYDGNKDNVRCSSYINDMLIESSYGTTISFGTKNPFFIRLRQDLYRNSNTHPEKMLKTIFAKLSFNCENAGLTANIIEYSQKIFYEFTNERKKMGINSPRSNNNDGILVSCIYIACKELGQFRQMKDIAKIFEIPRKNVTLGWNIFKKILPHYTDKENNDYSQLIDKYCSILNITNKDHIDDIYCCVDIVDNIKLLPKNIPSSLVCGCIYFIINKYNLNISKTKISEKCGVSIATINKTYQTLVEHTDELIES